LLLAVVFPYAFYELHKGARHASRRSFRFLSKPVAPVICEQLDYKRWEMNKELWSATACRRFVTAYFNDAVAP